MANADIVEAFDLATLNEGNLGQRLLDPAVDRAVEPLLASMSLEQKVRQMHGATVGSNAEVFSTRDEPELGIPALRMVDGPRGVRAGIATTFPVAMARGATWDTELEHRVGEAIGLEARARGANVILAPAVNLLRHPGWGRAQETYGEDSLHVGRMGVAFIAGAQRHVVATVKHFALNSIENSRFEVDVEADARTLREVYLPHFEAAVRDAHVGSVMSAYNKVNGTYCGENAPLLRDILKGEWGFRGFVDSDWFFGTRSTEASALAGLDLEMPLASFYGRPLLAAVRKGRLHPHVIDEAVRRILRVKLAFGLGHMPPVSESVIECHAHTELALEVAHKSMVLLKNDRALLPLAPKELRRIAVVGTLANMENTGDRASSAVKSSFVLSALEGICDALPDAQVDHLGTDALGPGEQAAVRSADAVIAVIGLTWKDEGENIPFLEGGGDRTQLRLSTAHEQLVRRLCALNPRTVVVLVGGSAIEVRPWIDDAPAVLLAWYPGMLGGEALADILFGRVCPSGKLPIVFARDAAALPHFDPTEKRVRYGLEHGYRHLLRTQRPPELPFGHGLSYTQFAYRSLALAQTDLAPGDTLVANVEVGNVGKRAGDEVVQLYLSHDDASFERPVRWLAGFGRLSLSPGETRRLRVRVTPRELSCFDPEDGRLWVPPGRYTLRAGPSSLVLPLSASFRVRSAL